MARGTKEHFNFARAYHLTGALWPVSSKAIQSGGLFPVCKSQQFVSRLFVSSTGGVSLTVLCLCLQGTVRHCQIQNNLIVVECG